MRLQPAGNQLQPVPLRDPHCFHHNSRLTGLNHNIEYQQDQCNGQKYKLHIMDQYFQPACEERQRRDNSKHQGIVPANHLSVSDQIIHERCRFNGHYYRNADKHLVQICGKDSPDQHYRAEPATGILKMQHSPKPPVPDRPGNRPQNHFTCLAVFHQKADISAVQGVDQIQTACYPDQNRNCICISKRQSPEHQKSMQKQKKKGRGEQLPKTGTCRH